LENLFMRFPIFRAISGSLLAIFVVLSSAIAADREAEFAIRWNPSNGGVKTIPKTAKEVINLLALPHPKVDEYEVSYFSIATPSDIPKGYSVIARQRTKGQRTQLMIKYRGDSPLPETYSYNTWQCALGTNAERKYEVDVTLLLEEKTKRTYSLSCSLRDDGKITFPSNLNAKQLGCKSKMLRYESNGIKIEEWTFYPGEEKIIEVSKSGQDNNNDFNEFKTKAASKLISSGIQPLESSKSATGTDCTR
jgi:hypothetical protein